MPFEIPESWVWVEMSDIFLLNPKNDINDNVDGGFIPMACVCDGYSGEHTFITKQWGDIKKGFSHFQNGDIGIAKISPCFENRKSVIFSDLPNNIGSGTTELVVLRGILVNTAFYLLLIKSDWYISEGTKYFKGVVGQQRVHKDIFTTLQVPMPPLREQQKIVDSVKKWFSVIDEIENGATELETVIKQTKSKILELAISGKLVPQDPNDEPAIELLKRIHPDFKPCDNSHYENLPENWCLAKAKDVFVINPRNKAEDNTVAGFIPMTLIDDGYSNTFSYEERKWGTIKTGFTHFANGDVAVAKISPCLENRKSIVLRDLPNGIGAGTTELHVFRSSVVSPEYALYFFKSEYFISRCVGTFNGVVGQQRVGKNIIEEIRIPIPPINEQTKIVSKIKTLFSQLSTITAEL